MEHQTIPKLSLRLVALCPYDIHIKNRHQILVPENWYQNLAPVFCTICKISGTSKKMADDEDEIAAVCAMVLIVYYIITNNLNNLE